MFMSQKYILKNKLHEFLEVWKQHALITKSLIGQLCNMSLTANIEEEPSRKNIYAFMEYNLKGP